MHGLVDLSPFLREWLLQILTGSSYYAFLSHKHVIKKQANRAEDRKQMYMIMMVVIVMMMMMMMIRKNE